MEYCEKTCETETQYEMNTNCDYVNALLIVSNPKPKSKNITKQSQKKNPFKSQRDWLVLENMIEKLKTLFALTSAITPAASQDVAL